MSEHPRLSLVILEGRDASGKTTTARIVARVLRSVGRAATRVALPRPSEAELRADDYFRRWLGAFEECAVALGGAGVIVFDRSWYNRASVERVMGYCTPAEVEAFYADVPRVEAALVERGVQLVKVFFRIGDAEQERRLAVRARRGGLTEVDRSAVALRTEYASAEEEMLVRTSSSVAPWLVLPEMEREQRTVAVLAALGRGAWPVDVASESAWLAHHGSMGSATA